MSKKKTYIETSIASYLTARGTTDLIGAGWQKATLDWWETQAHRFDLYVSTVTLEEASLGDADAAARRLEALAGIPVLEITDAGVGLAQALVDAGALPSKAVNDAFHVGVAAVHRMDYLLTWNFRHLDNAETKPAMRGVCAAHGLVLPEICTPHELMGVSTDG